MTSPNIIFIVLDTLRADRVKINGNGTLTPFMSKLAKESFFFENCVSNTTWTLPSHISMFTGLYPSQTTILSGKVDRISKKTPLIAEILQNLGYYTCCLTENAFISDLYGLTRGFEKVFNVWDFDPWSSEDYDLSILMKFLKKIERFTEKNIKNPRLLSLWRHFDNLAKKFVKFLIKTFFFNQVIFSLKNDSFKDLKKFKTFLNEIPQIQPKFLFFNFIMPHDPYIPFKTSFREFGLSLKDLNKIKELTIYNLKARLEINLSSKKLSNQQIDVIERYYNACTHSSDLIIKKLFQILKEKGLLDNSYVIITSDHGEHLGGIKDHNLWEHNTYQSVYDSLIKVPLIIYNKNIKHRIISDQVQLKDLYHTILNLTGKKNKYLIKEKSILYQIENNKAPKYIYGEYLKSKDEMYDLINSHRRIFRKSLFKTIYNPIFFLRSINFKYIKYHLTGREELYKIEEDPNEIFNLAKKSSKIIEMRKILEAIQKDIKKMDEIKKLITSKEKDNLKNAIMGLKIKGI